MAEGKLQAINPLGLYDPSRFYTHVMVVPPEAAHAESRASGAPCGPVGQ